MKKVDFIYFDAGGGHRAAASAVKEVMERQERPFEIRMVNLQEILDSLDVCRKATGLGMQDIYNVLLRKGWTLGAAQLLVVMHAAIRAFHGKQVEMLERFWGESGPDMVVSFIPNFNRALWEGLRRARPHAPLVTILTDIADYPPHFWIERQEQYFVCGSDRAETQARETGHAPERIRRVSGMIVSPRFYEAQPMREGERAERLRALGLDPGERTGLVLFGGYGAPVMEEIARRLAGRQLIAICGHNEGLRRRLRALRRAAPMYVEGFTRDVPRYMQLADYFIGKPGPGSLSEAMFMGLPVIAERNARTLPQERYNAEWIRERGAGIVLPGFGNIERAVEELLEPAAYARFREAALRSGNRAVFEIPDILEEVLERKVRA